METVSLALIIVGLAIIAVVLLMRWRLRQRQSMPPRPSVMPTREEPVDFDPLFAIDRARDARRELNELPPVHAESDEAIAPMTRSARTVIEPEPGDSLPPPVRENKPAPTAAPAAAAEPPRAAVPPQRSAPRVVTDPERVIAMNVMALEGQRFAGDAIAAAAQRAGLELGMWSIYHYYPPHSPESPPLFSMANMVKPGSFDPERMHEFNTVGLSLFMVPANDEHDLAAFDVMLAIVRQLASDLGGEVRDARRSVLTRQAIERLREQLTEWRFKTRAARS